MKEGAAIKLVGGGGGAGGVQTGLSNFSLV